MEMLDQHHALIGLTLRRNHVTHWLRMHGPQSRSGCREEEKSLALAGNRTPTVHETESDD
jgi:hypothetical protein